MLQEELLKKSIEKCLNDNDYHLYEMRIYKKQGELILAIEIDESLDLNQISIISEKISNLLDEIDTSDEHYILDVSSAGIERKINIDEIGQAINKYIHIDLSENESIEGDLLEISDECLLLKVRDKNLFKNKEVKKSNIKRIRYAIKF